MEKKIPNIFYIPEIDGEKTEEPTIIGVLDSSYSMVSAWPLLVV